MFETYIEDARVLAESAKEAVDDREAERLYRAAIFYLASATECFVSYVADTESVLQPHERAFLLDKVYEPHRGIFVVSERTKYSKLQDKLKYLMCKFVGGFDPGTDGDYRAVDEFIRFRHSIVHPGPDERDMVRSEYQTKLESGFGAAIRVMDSLSRGMYGKPLNRRLLDLAIE